MTRTQANQQPIIYQIKLQGHFDAQWAEWFGGLTISTEAEDETVLTGPIIDQAALHGLLRKIRDLGVPLLSVKQVESTRNQNEGDSCNS